MAKPAVDRTNYEDDPGRDRYDLKLMIDVRDHATGESIYDLPASHHRLDDAGLIAVYSFLHALQGQLISVGALKAILKGQIRNPAKLAYLGMVAKSGPCAPGDVVMGEGDGR